MTEHEREVKERDLYEEVLIRQYIREICYQMRGNTPLRIFYVEIGRREMTNKSKRDGAGDTERMIKEAVKTLEWACEDCLWFMQAHKVSGHGLCIAKRGMIVPNKHSCGLYKNYKEWEKWASKKDPYSRSVDVRGTIFDYTKDGWWVQREPQPKRTCSSCFYRKCAAEMCSNPDQRLDFTKGEWMCALWKEKGLKLDEISSWEAERQMRKVGKHHSVTNDGTIVEYERDGCIIHWETKGKVNKQGQELWL